MVYTILMFIVTSSPPVRYASRSDDFVVVPTISDAPVSDALVSDALVSDAPVSDAPVGTLFKASAVDNVFPVVDNVFPAVAFVIFQGANVDDNGDG